MENGLHHAVRYFWGIRACKNRVAEVSRAAAAALLCRVAHELNRLRPQAQEGRARPLRPTLAGQAAQLLIAAPAARGGLVHLHHQQHSSHAEEHRADKVAHEGLRLNEQPRDAAGGREGEEAAEQEAERAEHVGAVDEEADVEELVRASNGAHTSAEVEERTAGGGARVWVLLGELLAVLKAVAVRAQDEADAAQHRHRVHRQRLRQRAGVGVQHGDRRHHHVRKAAQEVERAAVEGQPVGEAQPARSGARHGGWQAGGRLPAQRAALPQVLPEAEVLVERLHHGKVVGHLVQDRAHEVWHIHQREERKFVPHHGGEEAGGGAEHEECGAREVKQPHPEGDGARGAGGQNQAGTRHLRSHRQCGGLYAPGEGVPPVVAPLDVGDHADTMPDEIAAHAHPARPWQPRATLFFPRRFLVDPLRRPNRLHSSPAPLLLRHRQPAHAARALPLLQCARCGTAHGAGR
mmetsp:Transcript_41239/g.106790  ORF Transcript_41239/g.106790 Transcript_41239/m.106790 type:complete len:463 (+) Transcript_41239:240-1628(+)